MIKKALLLPFLLLVFLPQPWLGRDFLSTQLVLAKNASPPPLIINEIAWMGTEASYSDEWIELRNKSDSPINLENWLLRAADGSPEIELAGTVSANGFYLLERTDDDSVPEIPADLIYTGSLSNQGEDLDLYDSKGNLIDRTDYSNGWPAGDNDSKQTMERTENGGWQTSKSSGGSPRAENSRPVEVKSTKGDSLPTQFSSQSLNREVSGGNPTALIIALALAVFSGIIILILKKKLKLS